jgi:hypothetical protein
MHTCFFILTSKHISNCHCLTLLDLLLLQPRQLWLPISCVILVFACVTITHVFRACCVCLLFCIADRYSRAFAGLSTLASHCLCDSRLFHVNSMPLLRSRDFKTLAIRAPNALLELSPKIISIPIAPLQVVLLNSHMG